ncbi:plasma membrane-associated cation-binding protein 1-like [Impatiens glandulifera]|uniref:plasma membrane-associated cation-binding protein 1-like n=1 Tax=Impatiens glandulifera TaxID=253017 RepID=UPI001FB06D0C|nr:plasma membrane-associated cation-binding protein 1-like [Impatiens glandulifera]
MGYWKSKVVPLFKKAFDKNTTKKLAASEATKAFDESKEGYTKEIEDKKSDLQTKVVEIYNSLSTEIKGLVKEPKEAGIKKQSASVQSLLDELAKIDFPGSKLVSEAASKVGPGLIPGPVIFILENVSTFIVTEEPAAAADDAPPSTEETKDREIVIESEKKEEAPETAPEPAPVAEVVVAVEKTVETVAVTAPETAKVEEAPAAEVKPVVT